VSHFLVLVVGDNPEEQLAPYHEFECTGFNDKYVQDIDVTEEIFAIMKEHNKTLTEALEWDYCIDEGKIVSSEAEVDREGAHKFSYAIVQDGKLIKAVNRTNPNRKWDWYVMGGRYTGFLKLKADRVGAVGRPGLMTPSPDEGYVDQAVVADIDFDSMRNEAGDEARSRYRLLAAALGGDIPRLEHTWEVVREMEDMTINEKRDFYHAQAPLMKVKELARTTTEDSLKELLTWLDYENYCCTEAEFIQAARDRACTPFALVKGGVWYERGTMGWWACVSDDKGIDNWNREVNIMLDGLDPSTLLTAVDCHI
jgi:hypothetical protein